MSEFQNTIVKQGGNVLEVLLILKSVIIAIVEGITEFLPVSSTGHMIIVSDLINFSKTAGVDFVNMYEIVIQLGAILAIMVLYREKIINSIIHLKEYGFRMWFYIFLAFLPSAIVGVFINNFIKSTLFNSVSVSVGLILGAMILLFAEKKFSNRDLNNQANDIKDISLKQAIGIGFFQILALWPGMSRSSSTISGAWIFGCSTKLAAEFSFFLAIPTMIGASIFELAGMDYTNFTSSHGTALIVGFLVAFLVALLVVDTFIKFLKKYPMRYFSHYRILIAVLLIFLVSINVIKV